MGALMTGRVHHFPSHVHDATRITAEITRGQTYRWIDLKCEGQSIVAIFYTDENTAYLDRLAAAINAVPDTVPDTVGVDIVESMTAWEQHRKEGGVLPLSLDLPHGDA